MKFISSFFASNGTLLLKAASGQKYPMTFEQLDQENGFVLYETQIRQLFTDPAKLEIEGKIFQFFFFLNTLDINCSAFILGSFIHSGIHDRGYVFVNQQLRGVLSRSEEITSMPLTVDVGDKLFILVENQGRIGYGPAAKDFKGIVSNVTLGKVILEDWTMYSLPLNDSRTLKKYVKAILRLQETNPKAAKLLRDDFATTDGGKGSFWYGEFMVPCSESSSLDTFLRFPNAWSKGV